MSAFSDKLAVLVAEYGSNTAFAALTGIPQPSISRLANAKNPPDPETINKMCQKLPDNQATELLLAWLHDLVPQSGHGLVAITAKNPLLSEETPEFGAVLTKLRPKVRAALERLAAMCLDDPEFGDFVVQSTKLYDPEWAKELDAAASQKQSQPASRKYPGG